MTRTNRPGMQRIQKPALFGFVVLLALVSIVATAGADPKIRCGSPTNSDGFVTITISLQRGDEVHIIRMADIAFPRGYPADEKADFIAFLISEAIDPNHTWITATHAPGSDEVQLQGQNGWTIAGHAIGQDGTGEPDWVTYDGASTGAEALCSLSGTATGTSPMGGAGAVGIRAFGGAANVATAQGMPAQAVESMLMQQLQSQGIPVRWAVPGDFVGPFQAMQHDESVLFITPPNANAPGALFESVADTGLRLDIMAVADPPDPTSGVVRVSGTPLLRLDVTPSVFSQGLVSIHYDAGSRPGLARVSAFDALGRSLGTLFQDPAGGAGAFTWDGSDRNHQSLPRGVYFLRLETPGGSLVRRVIRAR